MAWNRSTERELGRGNRERETGKFPFRGLVAGVIVVLGAAVAAWWLWPTGESAGETPPPQTKQRIKEVKPAAAPKAAPAPTQVVTAPKPSEPEYKVISAVTNTDGGVVLQVVLPDGTPKRIIKPPRQVWHNAADQLIAMAISIKPGMTAAPFPTGVSDDDFRRALKQEIVIYNDDTDEIKELKRRVRETRNEILDIMNTTHRSFEDILQEHRSEMNDNTKAYQDAVKGLAEVRKNGTEEDVRKYVTVMNAALQQVGAKELPYDDERPVQRGRGRASTKGTNK